MTGSASAPVPGPTVAAPPDATVWGEAPWPPPDPWSSQADGPPPRTPEPAADPEAPPPTPAAAAPPAAPPAAATASAAAASTSVPTPDPPSKLAGLQGLDLVRAVFPGRLLRVVGADRERGTGEEPASPIDPDDTPTPEPDPGGSP